MSAQRSASEYLLEHAAHLDASALRAVRFDLARRIAQRVVDGDLDRADASDRITRLIPTRDGLTAAQRDQTYADIVDELERLDEITSPMFDPCTVEPENRDMRMLIESAEYRVHLALNRLVGPRP